ncbi:MAG: hypothetical protein EOP73_05905 [Variovorax sp.]|jgi:hypothetical protein|nr:MAG: hypothetical protein EOP73_05905 [Variovorax sp.]
MAQAPQSKQPSTDLAKESAAGEEDPGSANEFQPVSPGDESPPGTPGTAKGPCPECGGSGRSEKGQRCPACDGIGTVTVNVGDA